MYSIDWEKVQMLIDANQISLIVNHLVEYVSSQISSLQMEQLGDLKTSLIGAFSGENKTKLPVKEFIDGFIDLINKGAIVGVDKAL